MNIAALLQGQAFTPPTNWRMKKPRIITSAPEKGPPAPRQLSDTNAQIKAKNRAACLAAIEDEPANAPAISKTTGLAQPTVHRIMRGLVKEGLATTFKTGHRPRMFRKAVSVGVRNAASEPTERR